MPSVSNKVDKDIPPIVVSESGVLKLLREIKVNKAVGPDELPNRVLQECAEEIRPAVTAVFQKSIGTVELPKDWRYANVAHLHFVKAPRTHHMPSYTKPSRQA